VGYISVRKCLSEKDRKLLKGRKLGIGGPLEKKKKLGNCAKKEDEKRFPELDR